MRAPRAHHRRLGPEIGYWTAPWARHRGYARFTEEGVVRGCLSYRDGSRADAVLFGRLAT